MTINDTSTIENQSSELPVNSVEGEKVEEGQAGNEVNTSSEKVDIENNTEKVNEGEKFAKAFSKRLNKEREKLNKEYEPLKKVVGLAAKQFNMTEEEYIKSILEDYGEEETPIKEKDEKDILIEELLAEKKEKEMAKEWETTIKALQGIDKDISIDNITDDMLIESDEKKIPLQYIYAYSMLTEGREAFEKAIEDKLMAKINKVNNSTAGSLTSSKVNHQSQSISSMSSKDFEALKERVKRGEKINL